MLKLEEFNKLTKPFIYVVNCNWLKVEKHFKLKTKTYIAIIEGKKCTSVDNTLIEFSKVFKFPNYFGKNWAAFDECINDLDWISSGSYILIIKDVDNVLKKELKDLEILVKILKNTAAEWANGRNCDDFPTKPTPFHIILHSEKNKKDALYQRLSRVLASYDYEQIEI